MKADVDNGRIAVLPESGPVTREPKVEPDEVSQAVAARELQQKAAREACGKAIDAACARYGCRVLGVPNFKFDGASWKFETLVQVVNA